MNIFESFNDYADQNVLTFPFVKTELTPIVIISSYLSFIYIIGPKFMEHKQPYKLKGFMTVYNIVQIVANLYLAIQIWPYVRHFNLLCTLPITSSHPEYARVIECVFVYMLLKLFDLVETIVFVLRKKQSQVSFLHVFHHLGVVTITWVNCKYIPGGQLTFGAFINGLVHAFMYSYYLISSWRNLSNSRIKRSITFLQIAHQIVAVITIIVAIVNPYCGFPKTFLFIVLIYGVIVVYLFIDFYNKNYQNKNKK